MGRAAEMQVTHSFKRRKKTCYIIHISHELGFQNKGTWWIFSPSQVMMDAMLLNFCPSTVWFVILDIYLQEYKV